MPIVLGIELPDRVRRAAEQIRAHLTPYGWPRATDVGALPGDGYWADRLAPATILVRMACAAPDSPTRREISARFRRLCESRGCRNFDALSGAACATAPTLERRAHI